jgi:GcrA cell cycle regulator
MSASTSAPNAINARIIAHHRDGRNAPAIADALHLTVETVHGRVRRLRRAGVLEEPRERSLWHRGLSGRLVPVPGPPRPRGPEWTDAAEYRLRELWDEGYSAKAIGDHLHVTKNTVISKAHRLDLPARPSPIHRADGKQPRPGVARGPAPAGRAATLPALASVQAAQPPQNGTRPASTESAGVSVNAPRRQPQTARTATSHAGPGESPGAPHAPPRTATTSGPAAQPQMARSGRVVTCCWPIGEPGRRGGPDGFRFCDTASEPGRPYCTTHCRAAYQPRHVERERAA